MSMTSLLAIVACVPMPWAVARRVLRGADPPRLPPVLRQACEVDMRFGDSQRYADLAQGRWVHRCACSGQRR